MRRTGETIAEYDALSVPKRAAIKDGRAFVGGLVRGGGPRRNTTIDHRTLITLDADNASDEFFTDVDLILGGTAYAIYSTHSDRPRKRKLRLIIPSDREMTPDEYGAVSRKIASEIGMDYFDSTTFQAARLMYFPSCSKDAVPYLQIEPGDPVSVDRYLSSYTDWRDVSTWPAHPGKPVTLHGKRVQDPHEKQGMIGLFCRAFTIEDGIERFLTDKYSVGTMPNRYTYAHGTSVNGLEVYPAQSLCYSHQDSDLISDGRTYNLYDLVRVHKFSALDADYSEGTKAIRPSVKAMDVWASNIPEVVSLKDEEMKKEFELLLSDAEETTIHDVLAEDSEDEPDAGWESRLKRDNKARVLGSAINIEYILRHGPFYKVLAYDSFRNCEVIRKALPWREKETSAPYEPWTGADDARLRHYLGTRYEIHSKGVVADALKEVSMRNSFHPIKSYLESGKWDGVPRVETVFIDYLGVEDTKEVREVTRVFFTAAVKRLYEPGCKFDEMVVLVGPQGVGKSTIFARLGREWFSDSLRTFETKEAGEHLQSGWIFELSELSAMRKSEIEEVKAFLSKTSDKYRVAYDRVVSDFPRKCVLVGTTNTKEFLRDRTGNRRFWPLEVRKEYVTKSIWEELTDEVVLQIWAEALTLYRRDGKLTLSKEAADYMAEAQSNHVEPDTLDGQVQEWLDTPIDGEGGSVFLNRVCCAQIWEECFHRPKGSMRGFEAKEIMEIMRAMPGWHECEGKKRIPLYGVQRVFERG